MVALVLMLAAAALSSPLATYDEKYECVWCMCDAISDCRTDKGCEVDVCGAFAITKGFWKDASTPLGSFGRSLQASETDFRTCALDALCSFRTVIKYMRRYEKDCNGNGDIDCVDYMAIHRLGPYNCQSAAWDDTEFRILRACLNNYRNP